MASRDILKCVPKLRELYQALWLEARKIGIDIVLTCTAREQKEQIALYSQGRESLAMVNEKRRVAFLPPITQKQNVKVTWTLDSKHITSPKRPLSEAFDIVIIKDKQAQWSVKVNVNKNDIPDYVELANIGRKLGLKPGADFKSPDYPHFEIPTTPTKEVV